MRADAVVALARIDLDDLVEPYLWPAQNLLRFVAEGQQEACLRADLLWDATSTFCELAIAANAVAVPLDTRINRIIWAGWDDGSVVKPLTIRDEEDVERESPNWRSHSGVPSYVIQKPTALRLVTKPASAGTLRLEVFRQPLLTDLTGTSELEIPARYGHLLKEWVVHRAYQTRDADKGDIQRSNDAEARYTAAFGPRPNVAAKESQQQRRNTAIRPGGF